MPISYWMMVIQKEWENDVELQHLIEYLKHDSQLTKVIHGRKTSCNSRDVWSKLAISNLTAGRFKISFHWTWLKAYVKTYIAKCNVGQRNKSEKCGNPFQFPHIFGVTFRWTSSKDCHTIKF